MWKRKLQFAAATPSISSSLPASRCGIPLPPPLSNINKHYSAYAISHFSTCNSSVRELKPNSFGVSISSSVWDFKNCRRQFNLLSDQTSRLFCSDSSKFMCWNCNAGSSDTTAPFLFCEACRSVQPVDHSVDYFHIFRLEKKYDIEEDNLEGKYKEWQKKLHPDLVHTKSQEEREYAAEQSARMTTAYRTLADPLARAIYILKLEGVDVDEEERISDPELLSEIMEIREAVEEARDTQTLNQIQEQMQKELGNWARSFTDAFKSRKYDKALASIQRMTYYKRAIEEVIKKL